MHSPAVDNIATAQRDCRLFYGEGITRPVFKASDLISYLPKDRQHHYRDGYSMAEAAKCWVHAGGKLPSSIARTIGVEALISAHFEYEVPVWGGGASTTDVMAFVPGGVIAVEAKAGEPFDDEVRRWIDRENLTNPRSPPHRQRVINRYARAFAVPLEALLGLRYQLLHRTLAAALVARRLGLKSAWMIAQSFAAESDDRHARNRADFDRYVSLVGSVPTLENVPVRLAWVDEVFSSV